MGEAKPRLVWVAEHDDDSDYLSVMERLDTQGVYEGVTVCRLQDEAAADLIADAGTVFNTTGLTPSKLVERVKEMEEALTLADLLLSGANMNRANVELKVRAVLSKARPNTAEGDAAQTAPASFAVAEPWWKSEDIEVTLYPPTSTSGLQIGMPKGVKVMHKPTGLFATSEDERSQHQNRDVALGKLQELLATAPTPAAAKEPSP